MQKIILMFLRKTPGIKPASNLDQENTNMSKAIDIIIEKYSSCPIVKKIMKNFKNLNLFSFQQVSNTNIYKL